MRIYILSLYNYHAIIIVSIFLIHNSEHYMLNTSSFNIVSVVTLLIHEIVYF